MHRYWDCSLCRIEDKGNARRCRACHGKLQGRERLLHEIATSRRARRLPGALSALCAGLGQIYQGRRSTGLLFGLLIPVSAVFVVSAWQGFGYGHVFLVGAAGFVLLVAAVDAYEGVRERTAPCEPGCPAGIAIPDYLGLCAAGEWQQGYSLVRTRVPLVGVIGRVCPRPCENRCIRGIDGEPIAINACKRFLADRYEEGGGNPQRWWPERSSTESALRVAIVGAGPAGLACAYYLRVLGASVSVYDGERVAGGRLSTTIPDYRLPPLLLETELEDLRGCGVDFRLGRAVGPSGLALRELQEEHGAVFLAVGAQSSLTLDIPGAEAFLDFQHFLREAKFGSGDVVGRKFAVIGGGNAAVDVARTAVRLGAEEAHLLYRRSRSEMPARADEVEEALQEGVRIHFLAETVGTVFEAGRLSAIRVRQVRLGAIDLTGRPAPEPILGSEWELTAGVVVPALGQTVGGEIFRDPALAGLRRAADGRIWVDPVTQRTSLASVYAGGDVATGPSTVTEAMAQGRRAALAIWSDCGRERPRKLSRLRDRRLREPLLARKETPREKLREKMPKLSLSDRGGFGEVDRGLPEGAARREAGRCLQCHRDLA
jgi:formate dehydrogenase major subunit